MHVDPCVSYSPPCRPRPYQSVAPAILLLLENPPPTASLPLSYVSLPPCSRPGGVYGNASIRSEFLSSPYRDAFKYLAFQPVPCGLWPATRHVANNISITPSFAFTAEPQRFDYPNRAHFRPQNPLIASCSIYIESKKTPPASPVS